MKINNLQTIYSYVNVISLHSHLMFHDSLIFLLWALITTIAPDLLKGLCVETSLQMVTMTGWYTKEPNDSNSPFSTYGLMIM